MRTKAEEYITAEVAAAELAAVQLEALFAWRDDSKLRVKRTANGGVFVHAGDLRRLIRRFRRVAAAQLKEQRMSNER